MFQTTNQYEFSIASIFPFLEVWHGLTPLASSVEPRYGTSLIFSKAQNGRNTVTVTVTSQVVVGRLSSKIVTVDKDVLMKLMFHNHGWGWDKSINKYLCVFGKSWDTTRILSHQFHKSVSCVTAEFTSISSIAWHIVIKSIINHEWVL